MESKGPTAGILFEIAVVKLDLRRIKVIFALSHLIADHEAIRIVQSFFNTFGTKKYGEFEKYAAPYAEYAEILRGQTDTCIRRHKKTGPYVKLKRSVLGFYRRFPRATPMHFSDGDIIECRTDTDKIHPIGKALRLILPLAAAQFRIRHVPLRILLNNRSFGDMKFYNTLGDMHDILPMLLDSQITDPEKLHDAFLSNYAYKTDNRLNYTEMARRDIELHDVFYTPISVNLINDVPWNRIRKIIAGTREIPGVPYPATVFPIDGKMLVFFPGGFSNRVIPVIKRELKGEPGIKIYKGLQI